MSELSAAAAAAAAAARAAADAVVELESAGVASDVMACCSLPPNRRCGSVDVADVIMDE